MGLGRRKPDVASRKERLTAGRGEGLPWSIWILLLREFRYLIRAFRGGEAEPGTTKRTKTRRENRRKDAGFAERELIYAEFTCIILGLLLMRQAFVCAADKFSIRCFRRTLPALQLLRPASNGGMMFDERKFVVLWQSRSYRI